MSMNEFARRLTPPKDSMLDRFFNSPRRSTVPPGGFLCGLRTEGRVAGLSARWTYAMSTIEGAVVLFGPKHRFTISVLGPDTLYSAEPPRPDFVVWAATVDGVGSELSVSERDAYLITGSALF
ncbi:hypothetical protein BH10ACT8_BH10ACT8_26090 [soil metagenome]|jgi:hypothetical protein